jgi:hypothetical protein
MKRTPLRRLTPLKAKTPLKRLEPIGKRSRAKAVPTRVSDEVYEAVWHRDGGICQAHAMGFALDVQCSGRLHVHHRVLRSQGGQHVLDNLLLICERMHELAHAHPSWAKACGVIVPVWADPEDVRKHDESMRYTTAHDDHHTPPPWCSDADIATASLHDKRWLQAPPMEGRNS